MPTDERQPSFDFGPPRPLVRDALPSERRRVLEVLGRAFFDDPIAMFVYPKDASRSARYGQFMGLAMDAFEGEGMVLVNDAVESAAIWQAPIEDKRKAGFFKQLRLMTRLLQLTRGGFFRAARLADVMGKHHLEEPHWYLAVLGTDPDAQGQGLGSAVMQPILDRCDRTRMPAYLESSKESNLPFYQKHGFEVIEELQIPDGPSMWPMVRRTG
ncbi:MAG: GNAT family N-acetyltransferase [Myxococcota bacterium]